MEDHDFDSHNEYAHYNNMRKASDLHKNLKENAQQRYSQDSATRLAESVEKKFRTTFIGAISAFEAAFGRLWGDDRPFAVLSDEEKRARRVWESVRTTILDNGNKQMRAAQLDLKEYTVNWNRHHVNLYRDL